MNALATNTKYNKKPLKSQPTILKELNSVYINHFQILIDNQKILQNQIQCFFREISEIKGVKETFSLSIVLDNLLLQLHTIATSMNNLRTAMFFAHLNILHESIIKPEDLQLIINCINSKYTQRQVPNVKYVSNYYCLFSTQFSTKNI